MNGPNKRVDHSTEPVNEPTKSVNEPSETSGSDVAIKPSRIRIAGLLGIAATLGAAVLVAAMSGPKLPRLSGD